VEGGLIQQPPREEERKDHNLERKFSQKKIDGYVWGKKNEGKKTIFIVRGTHRMEKKIGVRGAMWTRLFI